jgi:hypothetical protein
MRLVANAQNSLACDFVKMSLRYFLARVFLCVSSVPLERACSQVVAILHRSISRFMTGNIKQRRNLIAKSKLKMRRCQEYEIETRWTRSNVNMTTFTHAPICSFTLPAMRLGAGYDCNVLRSMHLLVQGLGVGGSGGNVGITSGLVGASGLLEGLGGSEVGVAGGGVLSAVGGEAGVHGGFEDGEHRDVVCAGKLLLVMAHCS